MPPSYSENENGSKLGVYIATLCVCFFFLKDIGLYKFGVYIHM